MHSALPRVVVRQNCCEAGVVWYSEETDLSYQWEGTRRLNGGGVVNSLLKNEGEVRLVPTDSFVQKIMKFSLL